jgi:hypothetical protein
MRQFTRALRTATLLAAAVLAFEIGAVGAVMAEPCVTATGNRPAIDVNPAKQTDPKAPRMHCDMVPANLDPHKGPVFTMSRWVFTVR